MSWHRQYRGHSVGRVLHFLYYYCGFDVAEIATVGWEPQGKEPGEPLGYILYRGKRIATFRWINEKDDIPVFTFLTNLSHSGEDLVPWYEQNQKEKLLQALLDQEPARPEPCRECQNLKIELAIYKEGRRSK
jgi:hypothetical protein